MSQNQQKTKQVELPEEYTDERLEAVIDTHTIPQFRLFLEDVYNRGRNDVQTPYKPYKPEWELAIDDWNWNNGGSLGVIKSSEDLLSLKELVSKHIGQAQQEAVERERKRCIKYMRSGEIAGSFSEGCVCQTCNNYEKEVKKSLKAQLRKQLLNE